MELLVKHETAKEILLIPQSRYRSGAAVEDYAHVYNAIIIIDKNSNEIVKNTYKP